MEDDGTPTGARPRHESGRTDPLRLQALIANNTQPPVATSVSIVDLDGASVIVVQIPNSPRVVGTTRGTYLRRAIGGDGRPTCIPYHAHEMLAHEVDRGAVDYAALPVYGATWEDLDPLEFERVRRLVTEAGDRADRLLAGLSDREIAHAMGLVRDDAEVTTGALLLFGRSRAIRRFISTHEAAFQVLRGLEVEVNDFFTEPLFRLAEEMFSRFRARNREEELQLGLFRVAVPAYSESAFREALAVNGAFPRPISLTCSSGRRPRPAITLPAWWSADGSRHAGRVSLAKRAARGGEVAVATMHRMKGLEFHCAALIGVGRHQVPAQSAVTPAATDQRSHDLDIQRERCLLFVACTRAREQLVISWHGAPSPLLPSP